MRTTYSTLIEELRKLVSVLFSYVFFDGFEQVRKHLSSSCTRGEEKRTATRMIDKVPQEYTIKMNIGLGKYSFF